MNKKELTKEDVDKMLARNGMRRGVKKEIQKTGENSHQAAIKLSELAAKLEENEHIPSDEDVDYVLECFCIWYGHSYKQFIQWARRKDGFGLFETDLSIKEEDLESIRKSWKIIENKCHDLFLSNRFSTENYDKHYSKNKTTLIECINEILNVPANDDEKRDLPFIHLGDRIYSGFYDKKE